MTALRLIVKWIDRFTDACGRRLAWLCLAMAALTCIIVLLRYGLGVGSVALQEAVTYMHGAVFMLGAACALKEGGHVRVDILYRRFSPRGRAWVDSAGAVVFLIPFCVFLAGISWEFVRESWAVREGSADPGGIHAVFLLKSLILLLALSLLLQAIAELLRNALFLVDDAE